MPSNASGNGEGAGASLNPTDSTQESSAAGNFTTCLLLSICTSHNSASHNIQLSQKMACNTNKTHTLVICHCRFKWYKVFCSWLYLRGFYFFLPVQLKLANIQEELSAGPLSCTDKLTGTSSQSPAGVYYICFVQSNMGLITGVSYERQELCIYSGSCIP